METIKSQLEIAMNNTFPMRLLKRGEFGIAGEFTVDGKRYAFMGSFEKEEVTCRCIEKDNYANHWYQLISTWEGDKRILSIGEES